MSKNKFYQKFIHGIRRGVFISSAVSIMALWFGITWKYHNDNASEIHQAHQRNRDAAIFFEENILRTIGEIDKTLVLLRGRFSAADRGTTAEEIRQRLIVPSEIVVQLAFIDEFGMMRASTAEGGAARTVDLSDRAHFRVHLANADDSLFISEPMIGRVSGKWSVQLTRRVTKDDGAFGGVIVASLDPAHFTKFYSKIDLGFGGTLSLIGIDGIVRATTAHSTFVSLGRNLSQTQAFMQFTDKGDISTDQSGGDKDTWLVTIKKVRGHPLAVMVSVVEATLHDDSMADLRSNTIVGLAITIIVMLSAYRTEKAENQARLKSEQLRLTLENMNDGIALVTPDFEIPVLNRRFVELLDLPDYFLNTPPKFGKIFEFMAKRGEFDREKLPEGVTPLAYFGPEDQSKRFAHYERTRPNGVILEIRSKKLADGGFVRTCTDVTHTKQNQVRIAKLAAEDALTGLANRRAFQVEITNQVGPIPFDPTSRAASEGFAVLTLDLDRFKAVNDTLGHPVGDLLLQAVAQRLKAAVRSTDVLARLGGDEFAILLPGTRSLQPPERVGQRIIQSICKPYTINAHQIHIGVSIGIARFPEDGTNADDLLVASDLALYAAKIGGRTTYRVFEKGMNENAQKRRQIELDLETALERDELDVHYQPIINLRRNEIVGFEALARWPHPVKGMISPGDFIPVAEECGLIVRLGEWILRKACLDAVRWNNALRVSVNLSAIQFKDADLVEKITGILEETGLSPDRLEVEITETILMNHSDATIKALHDLKKIGIRIAMDDFGTGYSSLNYLQKFPFDKIKIDRSFISDLEGNVKQAAIVAAVINIAQTLGMVTTAEGVETEGQKERLIALGCEEVQGFLLGKPSPGVHIPSIIDQWSANHHKVTIAA